MLIYCLLLLLCLCKSLEFLVSLILSTHVRECFAWMSVCALYSCSAHISQKRSLDPLKLEFRLLLVQIVLKTNCAKSLRNNLLEYLFFDSFSDVYSASLHSEHPSPLCTLPAFIPLLFYFMAQSLTRPIGVTMDLEIILWSFIGSAIGV